MGISINPAHFKRYKDVVYLLMKYGQDDLLRGTGLIDVLWQERSRVGGGQVEHDGELERAGGVTAAVRAKEEQLTADLERLGPVFVKLGQYLARRPELLSPAYAGALAHLGEDAGPMSISEVEQIVESETGDKVAASFDLIEATPLSVSVLDQTQKAVLRNGGKVILKVQRPGIREEILSDLEALSEVVDFYVERIKPGAPLDFRSMFDEFRKITVAELDYRQEAHNLRTLRENLKSLDRIVVPAPISKLSLTRMLTLEYIEGAKITSLRNNTGLLRSERVKLAEQFFYAFLQQIFIDGFVDANPDPQNVLFTNDGRLALLDLGTVARLTPGMQSKLLQLLIAIEESRADYAAAIVLDIGEPRNGYNASSFHRHVAEQVMMQRDMSGEKLEIGTIVQHIARASIRGGVSVPWELSMLGGNLANADAVARMIEPRFDSNSYLEQNLAQIMKQHAKDALSPTHVFHTLLEATEFVEKMPGKVGKILDSIASNDLKLTVHTIDEQVLMSGFQKIANRITVGLVLAALILGASLLMRVPTRFTIGGYPGLAALCFFAATGFGFVLIVEILLTDRRQR